MAQNELVKKLLEKEGYKVNILTVSTKGDRDRKSSVTELGGNGPFVRDVEKALLSKEADIAVHCVKDLPYEMAPGLCIAGMPDAADPRDCLILRPNAGRKAAALQETMKAAALQETMKAAAQLQDAAADNPLTIGTGSPRRISQLRALSGKLGIQVEFKDTRGNITTRLDKLRRGEYDGIVLAKAGLDRIGADLSGLWHASAENRTLRCGRFWTGSRRRRTTCAMRSREGSSAGSGATAARRWAYTPGSAGTVRTCSSCTKNNVASR